MGPKEGGGTLTVRYISSVKDTSIMWGNIGVEEEIMAQPNFFTEKKIASVGVGVKLSVILTSLWALIRQRIFLVKEPSIVLTEGQWI